LRAWRIRPEKSASPAKARHKRRRIDFFIY